MILQNGKVLQAAEGRLSFQPLSVRISNHKISQIHPNLLPCPGEECVDLEGDYLLPGMVNSHSHSYTNILQGTSQGKPLELWSLATVALGGMLTEEDMALSTALGICEMVHAGVTSCVDHLPHLSTAGIAAKTYLTSGFRAALAPMLHNVRDQDILYGMESVQPSSGLKHPFPSPEEYMDFYQDFIKSYHRSSPALQVMLGINSPQRADDSLLVAASQLSQRYSLQIHSHLLETKWQRLSADKQDTSPCQRLDRFSLLKEGTSLAHCLWLNEEELDLLAERRAIAVSNPTSNYFLGNGVFPVEKFLSRGITVALGSDGSNCGTNHNMLEILRFFLLQQRAGNPDYTRWIQEKDGFDMITANGGMVLGHTASSKAGGWTEPSELGSIQTGCMADLSVVNKNCFLSSTDDSLGVQLLFHNTLAVRHVLIDGDFVMRDYKITTIDEEALRTALSERLVYLKQQFDAAIPGILQEQQRYESAYRRLFL